MPKELPIETAARIAFKRSVADSLHRLARKIENGDVELMAGEEETLFGQGPDPFIEWVKVTFRQKRHNSK